MPTPIRAVPPPWTQNEKQRDQRTDGTTDESNLAPTMAPVVIRKGKQRILHHSLILKRRDNPTYGATRNNANPNTCGTTSTDSKRETKGPGHTRTYVPHSRDRQPAETALSQGEHQGPHPTTVQRITDLLRKSQELTYFPAGAEGSRDPPASVSPCCQLAS